jgi:SET domain-containing protein
VKFAVRRSPIHGRGCFASEPIEAGEVIGRFEGESTTDEGDHVLWLDDDRGLVVTNELRYLNHDPEPNAEFDGETLEVWAVRPVAEGEELTIHYGDDWA